MRTGCIRTDVRVSGQYINAFEIYMYVYTYYIEALQCIRRVSNRTVSINELQFKRLRTYMYLYTTMYHLYKNRQLKPLCHFHLYFIFKYFLLRLYTYYTYIYIYIPYILIYHSINAWDKIIIQREKNQ